MRKFEPKDDKSKKNYYDYRFFVPKESVKIPTNETKFIDDLNALKDFKILKSYVEFDNLVLFCEKDDNLKILKELKNLGYTILCELSGVDFITSRGGIEVFYQLLDMTRIRRARLKCFVPQKEFLNSATPLFKSANWAERELYDMLGVWIKDHPNLSRILMPDDWYGHPLLKSYPLQGDDFAKWYEIDKIFGKERREEFGEENRDPAFVDSKDTFNFSQIYHETEYGGNRPEKEYLQEYQEDGGVPFVKRAKRDKFKIIKKRK